MAVRSWNYHGTIQYVVDAEADLATIPLPKVGEVALALAEGSFHFHTGTAWQEIGGGGAGDVATDAIWDAKGDLAGGTGANTAARLAVGTDDSILMADSVESTGLKWAAPATTAEIATVVASAEAAGTSDTYARGDHVHLVSTTTPSESVDIGDTANAGTSASVTRVDHRHSFPAPTAGYPLDVAGTEADGTATTPARSDHVHAHGTLTTDVHTNYRQESVDHTHQTTGAEAGQLDHGLALTGLTDDDHTQYRLESADHTHQTTGAQAGTLDHGLALTGLTDDDHTQYRLETERIHLISFSISGNLSTGTGAHRFYNDSGRTLTFAEWRAAVGTAPATTDIIVDVNVDGTTIMTGTKVVIAAAANTGSQTTFSTTTIADGSYITVDVDQVGTGTVGADLVVSGWVTG